MSKWLVINLLPKFQTNIFLLFKNLQKPTQVKN